MTLEELDRAMLDAHESNDVGRLIELYQAAADLSEVRDDVDAACFYLTHAYVFALEYGSHDAPKLQERLWRYGREVPLFIEEEDS